jgi:hypothetical protein
MSDGPHKSLRMRRGWKKFAARADKAIFEPDHVRDAVCPALEGDWNVEVAPHLAAIQNVLGDSAPALPFKDLIVSDLEGLKRRNPGNSLWCAVIDGTIHAVLNGSAGPDALLAGATAALLDRGARGVCQVEEHWLRKTTERRTERMRARMMEGIAGAQIGELARRLLGLQSWNVTDRPAKHDGLDDGVRL